VSRECVQEIGTSQGHPHSGIAWCCFALTRGDGGNRTLDLGFAGPDPGDSDPCSPLAGFRIRVC
jgi:hypothetical protein